MSRPPRITLKIDRLLVDGFSHLDALQVRDAFASTLDRLVAGETIQQGRIGVILEPDEPSVIPFLDDIFKSPGGVKIKEVARKSPAAEAKLRAGDRLLALDGQPIGDLAEIKRRLSDRAAGEELTLTVKRRWRKAFDVTITLARPSEIEGLGEQPPPVSTEKDAPDEGEDDPQPPPSPD